VRYSGVGLELAGATAVGVPGYWIDGKYGTAVGNSERVLIASSAGLYNMVKESLKAIAKPRVMTTTRSAASRYARFLGLSVESCWRCAPRGFSRRGVSRDRGVPANVRWMRQSG